MSSTPDEQDALPPDPHGLLVSHSGEVVGAPDAHPRTLEEVLTLPVEDLLRGVRDGGQRERAVELGGQHRFQHGRVDRSGRVVGHGAFASSNPVPGYFD